MSDDKIPAAWICPSNFRISVACYLHSEGLDATAAVVMAGNLFAPAFGDPDPWPAMYEFALKRVTSPLATDWRAATKEEIDEYENGDEE